MERTLGINPNSPSILGIFGSPPAEKNTNKSKNEYHTEMRCPKRSVRRTTMMGMQLNKSLRQSGILPAPSMKIQAPR